MNIKNISIIIFVSILINVLPLKNIQAQKFIDLATIGSNYIPENKYENDSGDFSFVHNYINLKYPHVFDNDNVFLTKLSLNHYSIMNTTNLDMYLIYLQFGYLYNFSEKTAVKFAIYPKIASQLKDVDERDFVLPVTGLIQFSPNDDFTYGFGFLFRKEFYGPTLTPIIHLNWIINEKWYCHANLPSYGYLMYYPIERFKTGLYIASSSSSIRLSEAYNNAYIAKSYGNISLFFDFYLTKKIVFRINSGYSMERSLDLFGEDDTVPFGISIYKFNDNSIQLNDDIKNAYFIEMKLSYRYHY